jgi:hypothetical protein
MPPRRIHLVKVPTGRRGRPEQGGLFPYSHFQDQNHDPHISAGLSAGSLVLRIATPFKLKPNVQVRDLNRIDIYMPQGSAVALAADIAELFAYGAVPPVTAANPNRARQGPQALPHIHRAFELPNSGARVTVAGYTVTGDGGRTFVELESPAAIHVEMGGYEVHVGVPLQRVIGVLDVAQTWQEHVPNAELRVEGEANPVRKADGAVRVRFSAGEAARLAAGLRELGNLGAA